MFLKLLFHGGLDLMRVFEAHGHHADGVADEVECEMVLQYPRIVLEDRGFLGLVDMLFESNHALRLHRFGQGEQQAQKVNIVLLFPLGAGHDLAGR